MVPSKRLVMTPPSFVFPAEIETGFKIVDDFSRRDVKTLTAGEPGGQPGNISEQEHQQLDQFDAGIY